MATFSAVGTGTSGAPNYTLTLTVNETSYSTSDVSWNLTLSSSNGYSFSSWSFPITCNVDGEVYNETISRSLNANSSITIASGTKTIAHNSDGTKAITCSATVRATAAYYLPGNIDVSGTLNLTTIPRKSSVACASFNIGDSTTITITRADNSFTHTLTWSFGGASGTITTKTSAITIVHTFNAATLYAQIPNATYGTGTITCQTYSGNTLIGTSTCNFRAYAVVDDCVPTVSATIIDTNSTTIALTGNNAKLIRGFSTASVTISATPKNSATISSYYIATGDGRNISSSTGSFIGIKAADFLVQAMDSRYYVTRKTYNKATENNWINYIYLAFTTAQVVRPESTADTATITLAGNYFNGNFGSVNNTLTVKYRYKESGGSYGSWVTVTPTLSDNTFSYSETLSSLSHNSEFVFEFNATDQLMDITQTYTLTQGVAILRIGKNYIKLAGTRLLAGNSVSGTFNLATNITAGSWQYVHPTTPTITVAKGIYRFIVGVAVAGSGTGIATLRPLIDNAEIGGAVRSTFPLGNGLTCSTQVEFFYTFATAGTHYINAQLYANTTGQATIFNYQLQRLT